MTGFRDVIELTRRVSGTLSVFFTTCEDIYSIFALKIYPA